MSGVEESTTNTMAPEAVNPLRSHSDQIAGRSRGPLFEELDGIDGRMDGLRRRRRELEARQQAIAWHTDVAQAAAELGYGIELLEPRRIVLSRGGVRLHLESLFVSGRTLRGLLRGEEPRD